MPKRVTEKEKKEILEYFVQGLDLKNIAKIYNYSTVTISKQLKIRLGDDEFEKIKLNNSKSKKKNNNTRNSAQPIIEDINSKDTLESRNIEDSFFEIVPISNVLEIDKQKDLSSEPLKDANLPDLVYMLVDKKIELSPKELRDYPEWGFLPEDDLSRLTLEIFADQRFAKKCCSKNQKLIKVPNPKVFLLASKSLKKKGISRIIFADLLLAL